MNNFDFCSPTRIIFGSDAIERVGCELSHGGFERVLIVYGGESARRTGTLRRVKDALRSAGIFFAELGGVRPNPEIGSVREGIHLACENDVELVLAVGGGSVMDCAKAIALGTVYEGDVWDFFMKRATPQDHLPVAAVVTIPASGSEASDSCVISNDEEHLKCGCNTPLNRPSIAFLDPQLTYTLPPYQTAAGATDMICHIMERFFSGENATAITDNMACGAIRAIIDAARIVIETPNDYEARATLMWAGTLAHNGLFGCGMAPKGGKDGDWSCHGMEHELSALDTTITHGAGLAVIFPAWMRYVWREHPERFLTFGREVFGIEPVDPAVDDLSDIEEKITPERAQADAIEATIDVLQEFFVSLGMPRTLGELGVAAKDIDRMLDGLRITRGEQFGTFKKLALEDARAIYQSAL